MASPFPGMDPYLEGQVWPDFHAYLITEIGAALVPVLRPKYVVRIEQYVYLEHPLAEQPPRLVRPDLVVSETGTRGAAIERRAPTAQPTAVLLPVLEEAHRRYVAIRLHATNELVTVIEVLSPVNKRPRSGGQADYLEKRDAILRSTVHLLEIDLLRGGEPLPMGEPLPDAAYYVIASRASRRPHADVWAVGLREPLPTVAVPLAGEDPDAPLPLGPIFSAVYERAGFDYAVDYTAEPTPPLDVEQTAWARAIVTHRDDANSTDQRST